MVDSDVFRRRNSPKDSFGGFVVLNLEETKNPLEIYLYYSICIFIYIYMILYVGLGKPQRPATAFASISFFQSIRPSTRRIIPVSKWLVTPMYKPFRRFRRRTTLLRVLTMVINHLPHGMILQAGGCLHSSSSNQLTVNWWFGFLGSPKLKGIVTWRYPDSNPKPPIYHWLTKNDFE